MYPFYIRESFYPLRSEYNDYCRWAAAKLPHLRFGSRGDPASTYARRPTSTTVHAGDTAAYRARRLVLGTGTPPHLPAACRGIGGDLVHNSRICRTGMRCGASAASPSSAAGRAPRRSTRTCWPTSTPTATG